jgi:hypothetical protein
MLDSKQQALVFLMEESNRLATVCANHVNALHLSKTKTALEHQLGVLFAAMKEIQTQFKLDEEKVEHAALRAYDKRVKEI